MRLKIAWLETRNGGLAVTTKGFQGLNIELNEVGRDERVEMLNQKREAASPKSSPKGKDLPSGWGERKRVRS